MSELSLPQVRPAIRQSTAPAILITGIWSAIYLHLLLMVQVSAWPVPWREALAGTVVRTLCSAAATLLLVGLARRLRLQGGLRIRDLAVLVLLLPFLAFVMSVVEVLDRGLRTRDDVLFLAACVVSPFSLALSVVAIVLAFLVVGREERSGRERRRLELEALWTRSRAEQLRARLSPPFLFRVMETIASRIELDPDEAEETLERFAELLRTVVDLERVTVISLEQELEIVDRFVALSPGGGRLRLTADDAALRAAVPPLLVYSAVAAVASEGAPEIAIAARGAGDVEDELHVTLSVPRPRDPKPFAARLVPLEDRLRHLYPHRQTLLRIDAERDPLTIEVVLPRLDAGNGDDHQGADRGR